MAECRIHDSGYNSSQYQSNVISAMPYGCIGCKSSKSGQLVWLLGTRQLSSAPVHSVDRQIHDRVVSTSHYDILATPADRPYYMSTLLYAPTGLGKPSLLGREQPRDQESTDGMRPTALQSAAALTGSPSSWYCMVNFPEPESPLPL